MNTHSPHHIQQEKQIIDLEAVNEELENKSPQEIIRWGFETFASKLAMLSSMQKTASVLTHLLYMAGLKETEIIFIDTGYHFPETLQLRDQMNAEYGVNIITYLPEKTPKVQEQEYGRKLFKKDGDYQLCCKLRKEEPYLRAAKPFHAMLSGLMRSEGGTRKNIGIVSEDKRIGVYKIHPLANWNRDRVEEYIKDNKVLVHPLHYMGYPSIAALHAQLL